MNVSAIHNLLHAESAQFLKSLEAETRLKLVPLSPVCACDMRTSTGARDQIEAMFKEAKQYRHVLKDVFYETLPHAENPSGTLGRFVLIVKEPD